MTAERLKALLLLMDVVVIATPLREHGYALTSDWVLIFGGFLVGVLRGETLG